MRAISIKTIWAAAIIAAAGATVANAATLDRIRAAQRVSCGAVQVQLDFTKDDTHGSLGDLALDFCRAMAAAVLGDPQKVQVMLYPDENHALAALQAGQSDVMIGASATADRAERFGLAFAPPLFIDGQGFMVDRAAGIHSFADLAGQPVCYISGTANERRLLDAERIRHIAVNQHPFEEVGEMEAALVTGHCAAVTADATQLAEDREQFHARSADFIVLPELIALDPVTPAYAADDPQWGEVITRAMAALIEAEELGLTRENVAQPSAGGDKRGRADDWTLRIVRAVGNYGEMFERDLGVRSALRFDRGSNNKISRDGGLIGASVTQN